MSLFCLLFSLTSTFHLIGQLSRDIYNVFPSLFVFCLAIYGCPSCWEHLSSLGEEHRSYLNDARNRFHWRGLQIVNEPGHMEKSLYSEQSSSRTKTYRKSRQEVSLRRFIKSIQDIQKGRGKIRQTGKWLSFNMFLIIFVNGNVTALHSWDWCAFLF